MIRRDFFKVSALGALSVSASANIIENKKELKKQKSEIVICGAGFAGLSVAKFLREFDKNLQITLIEKRDLFISCPYSNTWLGSLKGVEFEDLCFDYNTIVEKNNYNFINEEIIDINRDKKEVITSNNSINYDYLIMAVGISYDYSSLFTSQEDIKKAKNLTPAGLKPGSEQLKLKKMIKNSENGNFIIVVPKGVYKCPPAPYERACMIANYFKENKIDSKVIIIDSREKPAAKAKEFLAIFKSEYKDYIEYKSLSNFKAIDFEKKIMKIESFNKEELEYLEENIPYKQASIMPENRANHLINLAKLETYENGWAKLQNPTFKSSIDDNVYIVGDAQGEYKFPKSAQMAYSSSYILAKELYSRINKKEFNIKDNLPGNICYSMIDSKRAIAVTHSYSFDKTFIPKAITTPKPSEDTAKATRKWFEALTKDILS